MKRDDWFPNEEDALERGNRVLDAIRDDSWNALQREMAKTVVINEKRVKNETLRVVVDMPTGECFLYK